MVIKVNLPSAFTFLILAYVLMNINGIFEADVKSLKPDKS